MRATAKGLLWVAGILLVLAPAGLGPEARFFTACLAAVFGLIGLVLALSVKAKRPAFWGGLISVFAVAFAFHAYPDQTRGPYAMYLVRAEVSRADQHVQSTLSVSCLQGGFASKPSPQQAADMGPALGEAMRIELHSIPPNAMRVKMLLREKQGSYFGFFPWTILPESTVDIEYVCTPEQKISRRAVASTLPSSFLPAAFR